VCHSRYIYWNTANKMSSRAPDLLSNIFANGLEPRAAALPRSMIPMKSCGSGEAPGEVFAPPASRRRTAIWDMHRSMHCSIIGTCLSSGEIRRLLIKLGVHGAESAGEHALHKQGVALAGQAQGGGKFIQKALDRRHEAAIKQFAKAQDENGLRQLWDDALKRGDIPGAYWAVLSHPAATDAIMRKTFGDVHMLSHMVGAANRADIRRLCQLERENAVLSAKLEQQQRRLRDGFVERDAKIRLLNEALSRALARAPASLEQADDDARAAEAALVDVDRRLNRQAARCKRLESRLEAASLAVSQAERAQRQAEGECERLRRELSVVEAQIAGCLGEEQSTLVPRLGGAHVLYVGGRAHQVSQLKAAVERAGGKFLYHDGGIEHSMTLLPSLISRANCAAFPIDCMSHEAMGILKRQRRQLAKPFVSLRTSSLASLLAGLTALERGPERVMAVN